MAQEKSNKKEGTEDHPDIKNNDTAKSDLNSGENTRAVQKSERTAEGTTEKQKDEMVTESIDIIQDASEKDKDGTKETSAIPKEQKNGNIGGEQPNTDEGKTSQTHGETSKIGPQASENAPDDIEIDGGQASGDTQGSEGKAENATSPSNPEHAEKRDQQIPDSTSEKTSDDEERSKAVEGNSSGKSGADPEKAIEKNEKTPSESTKSASENEEEDEDFAEAEEDEEDGASDDVNNALTEDSEDESTAERHDIPKKDYDNMSKEALIKEFRHLLGKHKIQAIKEHVDDIRAAFISQFEDEQEEAKERFLEDGGNIIDFRYYSPLKKEFNTLYFEYRDKRNTYFKTLKRDLNKNLEVRNALIEELKELKNEVGGEDSINTTFEKFRDIQERWRNAGNIPRDRYNLVWNNYHHHVENFYDFLHLNREFRDRDFKENLDKKMKLVEQAEELTKAQDINRAFKELQLLHKMWKEEIGPVAREYREEIWEKFSAATRSIHESRQEYFKNIDKIHEENLVKKQDVIRQIEEISATQERSHGGWQKAMRKVEALRDEFFKLGKVPRKNNEETWRAFKKATRTFNRNKNAFYKNRKKEQQENLDKKMELVKVAEDNKDNEDLEPTIELMKKIQADWKKIGHVPRRDSDKIWKRFKAACNHVFDRLHANKKEALEEEQNNLSKKQELIEKAKGLELKGERDEDLEAIKELSNQWKEIGRVPFSQKKIEKDFNKVLDGMFKKLDLGRKETEMIKYDNRMAAMADRDDERQIDKERYFISKKISEVKAEINQLENNLGFFQHVPDDNPMVKEVHKNIEDHKKTLEIWKAKMKKIKTIS